MDIRWYPTCTKQNRVIYENEDIVVNHRFIDFPSEDKEAVLGVMSLKYGKAIWIKTVQPQCIRKGNYGNRSLWHLCHFR